MHMRAISGAVNDWKLALQMEVSFGPLGTPRRDLTATALVITIFLTHGPVRAQMA